MLVNQNADQRAGQRRLIGDRLRIEAMRHPTLATLIVEPRARADRLGRGDLRGEEVVRREQAAQPTDFGLGRSRERNYLEELERQRTQVDETPIPEPFRHDEETAATVRIERPAPEPVVVKRPSFSADDLEIPSFLRRK